MGTLAPRKAEAEAAPTADELKRLTLGYQRMQTLLKDWQKITGGSCGNAQLSKEKAQVVATNGGALCDASPLVIQEYIGYRIAPPAMAETDVLAARACPC